MKKAEVVEPEPAGIPECYRDDLSQSAAIKLAARFLTDRGVSLAGPNRIMRRGRALQWEESVIGCSSLGWERDRGMLLAHRAAAAARLERLRAAEPWAVPEAERELADFDRRIGDLETLIAAVPADARINYRGAIEDARQRLDTAAAQETRYRSVRMPVPDDVQDEVLAAERELVNAERVFAERRALLAEKSAALRDVAQAAHAAFSDSVLNAIRIEGARLRDIVNGDLERLSRFPERLLQIAEAMAVYRVASRAIEIVALLSGGDGAGWAAFRGAMGEDASAVMAMALRRPWETSAA